MTKFYYCDPNRFKSCRKESCGKDCRLTTFEKYARRDEFGQPIVAYIGTKTYGDIYNEFLTKFPLAEVEDYRPAVGMHVPQLAELEDYRPAVEMHVPQLSKGIPNAIIVWLKDGTKVIYISESDGDI